MEYEQRSPADHVQLGFFLKLRVSFCLFYNESNTVLVSQLLYQSEVLWTIW